MSISAESPNPEATERNRRDKFFRDLDDSYARLQSDRKAWEEHLEEQRLWDATLSDGIGLE